MARNKKKRDLDLSTPIPTAQGKDTEAAASATTSRNKNSDAKFNSTGKRPDRTKTDRDGRRNSRRNGTSRSKNATLEQMNVVPAGPARQTFSIQSAAMQAFGNLITTPGQDNFLASFNQMHHGPGITDIPAETISQGCANRTANVAVLTFTPYFGCVDNIGSAVIPSPIMQSALNLKQYVDTSFGTRTNYSAGAMMLYLMAVSSVFPLAAEIRRDLKLAISFVENQYPQFVPRGLFTALGICDSEEHYANGEGALYTAQHLRSLADKFNQILNIFNRLPIPPEMGIFGYNDDLLNVVYTDTPDLQTAQLYAFRLKSVWMYEENVSPTYLMEFPIRDVCTVDYKLELLASLVNRLTALRTDSTSMLQNLFNAYGSRDTVTIPLLDIAEGTFSPLDFVYDERMLIAIENAQVCDDGVAFTPVFLDPATATNVQGTVYVTTHEKAHNYFNLPLQFHCDPGSVSADMVGWALRFHPSFVEQKTFTTLEHGGEASTLSHVTCAGYSGFAFIRGCKTYYLTDTGTVGAYEFKRDQVLSAVNGNLDFHAFPIALHYSEQLVDNRYVYTIHQYTARRDVELTYRLEDLHMHWVYLTQDIWASALNRNVVGTRVK